MDVDKGGSLMAAATLLVPFLTDDPVYAYGVEFGMLYSRLRNEAETVIADCFLTANQEQILLVANRLGWQLIEMKPWVKGWFWCRLERL